MLDQRAISPPASINLLRTGLQLRRPDHHRQPDLRARDPAPPSTAWAWTACCARAAPSVIGILNGVDYDDWDPRHDRHLPRHFGAESRSGVKAELKQQLLQRLQLDHAQRAPR